MICHNRYKALRNHILVRHMIGEKEYLKLTGFSIKEQEEKYEGLDK